MNDMWCWFSWLLLLLHTQAPGGFSNVAVEVSPDGTVQNQASSCLYQQNLVKELITNADIVPYHNKTCGGDGGGNFPKHERIHLGFVTPWNRIGYKMSLEYAPKYTHLSPVWFQVKRYGTSFMIFGENDIDKIWMDNIRKRAPTIRIIPRMHFAEDWTVNEVRDVLFRKGLQSKLISKIMNTIALHKFDGAVLEFPVFFNWLASIIQQKSAAEAATGSVDPKTPLNPRQYASEQRRLMNFIKRVGARFRKERKAFFMVMSPYHLGLVKSDVVYNDVTAIPLMTYDFGSISLRGAGPIAPYGWLQQVLSIATQELKLNSIGMGRLLLGLNFYGYEYSPVSETAGEGSLEEIYEQNSQNPPQEHSIVTHERLLKKYIDEAEDKDDWVWKWNDVFREHTLYNSKQQKKIWYPSLLSVAERLALAKQAGVGVAVWEIGQGFQYFNELL